MRKYLIFLLILLLITPNLLAQEKDNAETEKPVVTVVDFTNNSGKTLPEIGDTSTEVFSTLLVQSGMFEVVERAKLRTILTEQGLSMSGLVDSEKSSIKVGKLLGVDYLISGSIVSYDQRTASFKGYNVETEKVITEMTASIKVLNISTSKIEYAFLPSAQDEALKTDSFSSTTTSLERTLLTKILKAATEELVQKLEAKKPAKPEKVMVKFSSIPDGADIEIDNVYYGSTPATIPLVAGIHQVKISLAGYKPWMKRIDAFEGLNVKATLVKDEDREIKIKIE